MDQRVRARNTAGYYQIISREKYSYNGAGKLIEVLIDDYNSITNQWDPENRITLSYNASGAVVAIVVEYFDDPDWSNLNLDSFYYDAGGKIISKRKYSDDSPWIGEEREDFSYTGNLLTEHIKMERFGLTSWVNSKKLNLTYTATVLSSGLEYQWDGTAWSASSTARITWTGGRGLVGHNPARLAIYPNPAQDYLNISGLTGPANVQVLNLQGKEYLNLKLAEINGEIYLENLPPGLYLVLVQSGDQVLTTRLLKQ